MEFKISIPENLIQKLVETTKKDKIEIERELVSAIKKAIEDKIESKLNNKTEKITLEPCNCLLTQFNFVKDLINPSTSAKEWEESIKRLIHFFSEKAPISFFFIISSQERNNTNNTCEIEIFWLEELKNQREKIINNLKDLIIHKPCLSIDIVEHVINNRKPQEYYDKKEKTNLQIKYILLDKPKIGGILGVGIGIFHETIGKEKEEEINQILESLLSIISSIRALSFYTKEIEFFATRDALTNLYNQRVFWEFLEYELNRAKRHNYRVALLVIDLDNFKLINDTYGHIFGDLFIEKFSQKLQEVLEDSNIIARFGGDEFCIIIPDANLEKAYLIAQKIKEISDETVIIAPDGKPISATVSIGIAIFPDHADNAKDLFIVADNMMYKAKKEGKDRILYPSREDLSILLERKEKINTTLLYALKHEKVIPYFQPILSLKEMKIKAHEVLMRIENEKGEILPAARFIEVAEEMNIIYKLELLLFKKAFEIIKKENYSGLVFLNFSPKSIVISGYLDQLRNLAKTYGIDTSRIILEITERETVKNLDILNSFIKSLKEFGFRFAIDDFGSGYSSYIYIKKLPIDFVKIEGDFIKELSTSHIDKAIVKSVTVLSHELNIKTIAEFVEDKSTLDLCKKLGIDYAQGFFIGKPAPKPKN